MLFYLRYLYTFSFPPLLSHASLFSTSHEERYIDLQKGRPGGILTHHIPYCSIIIISSPAYTWDKYLTQIFSYFFFSFITKTFLLFFSHSLQNSTFFISCFQIFTQAIKTFFTILSKLKNKTTKIMWFFFCQVVRWLEYHI
jgi:hypothetical protein